ncbi:non-ribosomal peptide synthetase, partial [Frigidibacter sp. SD6-1]|uniref:non-ribosomal peptide synthetase n=1 Tax=Frigidibacter sp. SD6-1 TaxID=3032581 RepID=UPI0024DFCEE5
MTPVDLIERLRALGVELAAEGGRLALEGAVEALDDTLLAALRQAKPALLAHLEAGVIRPRDGAGPAPLSFQQQRLWFLDQLDPGSTAYNLPALFRLSGSLEAGALQDTLDAVMARHAGLRTSFALVTDGAGEARQVVLPPGAARCAIGVHDLSHLPRDEALAEARRAAEAFAALPFDLTAAPLMRAALYRLDAEDHLFAVALHHIVADGQSISVLMREVALLHAGQALPAPALDYADYSAWQRGPAEALAAGDEAYWRRALAEAPPLSTLPTDRPRRAEAAPLANVSEASLDPDTTDALRALAARHGTTLFAVLLAGYGALLARHARQSDLVIGTPVAGRTRPGLDGIIGFFVNMLAIRAEAAPDMTLADYLDQVRDRVAEGLSHQDLPFDRLVERLGLPRDLDRAPLFQTVFTLQARGDGAFALGGLKVEPLLLPQGAPKFDLVVTATEDAAGGLQLHLAHDAGLFLPTGIDRFARNLAGLLGAIARAEPTTRLGDLAFLGTEERTLVTAAFARGDRRPTPAGLVAQLAARAVENPDHPAVECGGESLTRGALDRLARAHAAAFQRAGVGLGDRVAIHAGAGVDRVAAMLGALRLGAAYVPLEPSYPTERLAFMVEDAAPKLIVGTAAADAFAGSIPRLDPADAARATPDGEPAIAPHPDLPAYLIYTSGSTGRPKGVVIPHRGLANLADWMGAYLAFTPDSRFIATMRYGFDGSVAETWPILAAGGTLVMASQALQDDPARLLDWLGAQTADACFLTTPLAELGITSGAIARTGMQVMTGGDKLTLSPPEGATFRLHNNYGPTETSVVATAAPVAPGSDSPPIGRPIGNTRLYLLNERLEPVPLGAVGEVFVAGAGVATGYHNQPGQTATAFLPDPFGPPGARMYRTGDLARHLPDGQLQHLGRADSQISLRGYRIEPGEVEAALRAEGGFAQALVVARDGRLIGYALTGADTPAPDLDALRIRLRQRLPDHMVPAAILCLDAWPMTPNGKIDRKALPAPDLQAAGYAPPVTGTEERLAALWSELLGEPRIGRADNFFALGGHSLLATQAASRLRTTFGVDLPLRRLFEAQTLADLARVIDAEREGPRADLPPLLPRPRTADGSDDLPLSFAQARLWFLDQLEAGNPFYNIPGALRLTGRVDRALLQATFDALVARHETLRTRFPLQAGAPRQVIAPVLSLPIGFADLSATPEATEEVIARDARTPFDLAEGPLVRVTLLRLAEEDHILIVNMHHIISDGWSMGVMAREVAALYAALAGGRPDPLPPLPVQYADFALWQRSWLSGAELARQEGYWLDRLSGLTGTPLPLPHDRPRPPAQSHRGGGHMFAIDAVRTARLRRFSQDRQATLFMVLNAVYAVLLARYSGQTDVPVGSPIANRRTADIEGMIGFFVNTLVLRHRVDPALPFTRFLEQVRQTALEAFDHQDLPFEQLVDLLNPERSLSHAPLFQVSFALQNAPRPRMELPGLTLEPVAAGSRTSKFDLTLTGFERDGGLHFDCEYAADLFNPATVERFCRDYVRLVDAVLAAPETPLHALPLLDEADLDRLAGWNLTDTALPEEDAIAAFEQRAAERPEATALRWNDLAISYHALDAQANRLAHALIAAGVRPGALVALGTGRGPDHVAAMIAVNKAGAAYVMLPLDAPAERLAYILADTGAAHVIGAPAPHWGAAVVIDPAAAGFPETPPAVPRPDLAYVVYTSGTTGQPKGSMNSHSGIANMSIWYADACGIGPGTRVSVVANIAFDGILPEIWPALMRGAELVLVPDDILRDPWALADHLARTRVEVLYLPMGYLDTLATTGFAWPDSLKIVVAGGDRMKRYLLPPDLGLPLLNIYGPSETQSISTAERIGPEHQGPVTIGRPIPNVRIHLLDDFLNPLPPGAVGEVCIAGAGLGQGYLNRPALTAERFMPDPFGPPGSRLYRTGDLGRFLPDGRIDFLGRADGQLKIRGFRVELAEIESALLADPRVAEALVLPQKEADGDIRLLAYVVPRQEEAAPKTHWETTFDQIYAEEAPVEGDAAFDIVGWTDSYSGAPIPAPEMADWLDETIARIESLAPRRVLEVGCGTGMILHRIAGSAESYTATDLSRQVLSRLSAQVGQEARIRLHHAAADDWSCLGAERFDTVILNSVAQYFPTIGYLKDWLTGAIERVDAGALFLGDIRNYALAEAFHLSVARARAGEGATIGSLRQALAREMAAEPELLVDPVWFHAFAAAHPRVRALKVLPKMAAAENELTRFRYDVVIEIGAKETAPPEDWQGFEGVEALEAALAAGPARLAVRDIPGARSRRFADAVTQLRELPESAASAALDAAGATRADISFEALQTLAARHGYLVEIGLAAGPGLLHALFRRDAAPANWLSLWPDPPRLSDRQANIPFQPERNAEIASALRDRLSERLPSYMVPWRVVVVGGFVLTGNGKVDRRVLPVPSGGGAGSAEGARGGVEAALASIWGAVLGIGAGRIGREETFFSLGG